MTSPKTAPEILERHYLEIRCGLLDVAAALDRIDRAKGAAEAAADSRRQLILQGLQILQQQDPTRAEQIQLLFSDEYQEDWNA